MLGHLHIKNLAVLSEASVEFESGWNVLTGETGAGKSIVVDSLALLTGARASADLIRTDADTLIYRFTVTDPSTWTKPWTAEVPMTRSNELMYEYACHEANYGMENLLKGARFLEKNPGSATTTSSRQQ